MKGRRRQKVQAQATLTKYLVEEESGGEEQGCGGESRVMPQDSGLVSREKGKKVIKARDDNFTKCVNYEYLKKVKALVAQSCPTLGDPVDCSPPGSSVHGILQAKNTGVSSHSLLQGIFPIKPGSPTLQADSLPSKPPGKPLTPNPHTTL